MFFMVGVIYDRVHHRDFNKFGGLMGLMPSIRRFGGGDFLRRFGTARFVRVHRAKSSWC